MNKKPAYVIFLLLDNFDAKSIAYKLNSNANINKYLYIGHKVFSLPLNWQNNPSWNIVSIIQEDLCLYYNIEDINKVKFNVINIFDLIGNANQHSKYIKDIELVPYFLSSYLDLQNIVYYDFNYFSFALSSNQGFSDHFLWKGWEELVISIDDITNSDSKKLLNNLLRPIKYEKSFSLSYITFLMLTKSRFIREYQDECIIAGGEVYSWVNNPIDIVFPFLINNEIKSTFCSLYIDTYNFLHLIKQMKNVSLQLLERTVGISLKHSADLISIKSRKIKIRKDIIGRVNLIDDDGFRTFYPITDNILIIKINGLGKVKLELQYPFYIKTDKTEFSVRDYLVIDTRVNQIETSYNNLKKVYNNIEII